MKRVLIVSFDFPPQGGTGTIRVAKFAKYLPDFGWQPVVVCSNVHWNPDASLARDVPAGVTVRRVAWPGLTGPVASRRPAGAGPPIGSAVAGRPGFRGALAGAARRILVPDPQVLWVPAARRAVAALLRELPCDAVLTTSPPNSVHLVGAWIHQKYGLPWTADFRDAWTADNPYLQRLGNWHFGRQQRVERRILEGCTRAIMITEPLARRVQEVFGAHLAPKLVTITNGFDPADFATPAEPPRFEPFTLTYVGTILALQTANAFAAGLRLAVSQDPALREGFKVRFVGQLDPAYQAGFAGLEPYVEFRNFVPHEAAIAEMRRSTALLFVLSDTTLASMTYTNKFFEYLAARRPILALAPPGLVADVLGEAGAGLVVSPDDPAAIARGLSQIRRLVRPGSASLEVPEEVLSRFDRRCLAGQLASLLDELRQPHASDRGSAS